MIRTALLIGADTYDDPGLLPLSAPLADVERLAALLRDPSVGLFDTVEVLLNRPSHELLVAVEDFTADRQVDDLLLLYLSCHGIVNLQPGSSQGLHFAAPNTRSQRPGSTSVPASFINHQFTHTPAGSRILLLDCCFSGRFAEGLGAKSGNTPLSEMTGGGYVVITASDAFNVAYEDTQERRSAFTDVMVEGLRTGDADRDADGMISTADMFDYVVPRMRQRHGQTPNYFASGVDGKICLARTLRPASRTDVPEPPERTSIGSGAPQAGQPESAVRARSPQEPTPFRDWPAVVGEVAAGLREFAATTGTDPERWPTELFGGVMEATAGLLAWHADALRPITTGILATAQATADEIVRENEGVAGPTGGWEPLLHGWWEEAQTAFANEVRDQPMSAGGWWGSGLCHAATGAYGRAAEAFTRAARYVTRAEGVHDRTIRDEWVRRIPVTSDTVRDGAALLAAAARQLAGEATDPALHVEHLVCSELRILAARQANEPERLAQALTADPAAAVLAMALYPPEHRPDLLIEALDRAAPDLGRRTRETVHTWAELREHAWQGGVDLPELLTKEAADTSDIAAFVAEQWQTLSEAERLVVQHSTGIVAAVMRGGKGDDRPAARVATLIAKLERELLPANRRATILPHHFLHTAHTTITGAEGVVAYPTWTKIVQLRDGGPVRLEDEERLRKHLSQPAMDHATLLAWLVGDLPDNHPARPGSITGGELAALLAAAGIPTEKRYGSPLSRRPPVDAGWLVRALSRTETGRYPAKWFLAPDGQTRIDTARGLDGPSAWGEEFHPPSRIYTESDLSALRQSLLAARSEGNG